jgi:hypothetical protein
VSEAPAGRQVVAWFSPWLVLSIAAAAVIVAGSLLVDPDDVFGPLNTRGVIVRVIAVLTFLTLAYFIGQIVWQIVVGRGEAIWIDGDRVRWFPGRSVLIHDIEWVGSDPNPRGSAIWLRLQGGRTEVISTIFISTKQPTVIHAIESLKLGLAARDGGASTFN